MSNAAAADISTTETNASTPPKVGLGVILIPVLLSTVLTLGVVGGGGFYLIRSGRLGVSVQGTGAPTQSAVAPVIVVAPPASHVIALEPMIVNLSDAGGHAYLRASVSLRIKDEEKSEKKEEKKDPKGVDTVATELRDTTLMVLSRNTSDELLLPDGRETLKKALEHEYKERNLEVPVLEVYFTDFLVQRG